MLDVLLVFVFILIGGVFAATELALVSLREGQARALAEKGRRGQRVAHLVANPNRFLAAVQGSPADLGGYYYVDKAKTDEVMRPSATFNAALADF